MAVSIVALGASMLVAVAGHVGATPSTPGTGGPARIVHFGSIIPQVNEVGHITLSQDAVGSNDPTGADLTIQKPAGATVRKAYMAAATTGFSGATLANGDVKIDGTGVNFTLSTPSAIASNNYWSEVTSLVKSKLDGAPAGAVNFHMTEANTFDTEGEILAVIFDDPNQKVDNTIVLLFGAQNVAGDTFNIGLGNPIDKSDPNLAIDLGLGISFGFQPSGQFSTVDVNGQRLTSSAGGQDDGQSEDGALITVGGVGDTNANPPVPSATDLTCGPPAAPRCDDELYNLLPFVKSGDSAIHVFTQNPSSDDNIFFASLKLNSTIAVVGEGVVLTPADATNPVGTSHTVTATVQDKDGHPISGRNVAFTIISGPNAGTKGNSATDGSGHATFTWSSSVAGVDEVQASMVNSAGNTQLSNVARKEWTGATGTPGASLTPSSFNFGNVRVGSTSAAKQFTFTSNGTAPLQLNGWHITGTNPSDFTVTATTCPSTFPQLMAVGTHCTVNIAFKPSTTGGRAATLSFADDASTSPQTAALSGTGIRPHTTLTETSDLSHAGAPFTATFTYKEHNDGTDPISGVVVTASQCTPLTLVSGDSNHNSVLDPGETWTYTCTRTFTTAGSYTDHASASGTDTVDHAAAPPETASLTVRAFPAVAALSPGYWKNHLSVAAGVLPLPLGNYSVTNTAAATQVFRGMNCSNNSQQNAVGCLAAQLLAGEMNVANNASNACIYSTINSANAFLKSVGYIGPGGTYALTSTQRSAALVLAGRLSNFNVGIC